MKRTTLFILAGLLVFSFGGGLIGGYVGGQLAARGQDEAERVEALERRLGALAAQVSALAPK